MQPPSAATQALRQDLRLFESGPGQDGAPAWAVITDGLSTCTPGERNAAPAVRASCSVGISARSR